MRIIEALSTPGGLAAMIAGALMDGYNRQPAEEKCMAGVQQLGAIDHVVVLMLENRSFDHMLGFLYADRGNESLSGQSFDGLSGTEANPDANGKPFSVFTITPATPYPYLMPGAAPGEGFQATNSQL